MTIFRPCIDLHEGRVKQIVGGSLTDEGARENFVSEQPASWFAERYERDALVGGHVIQLGPGNEQAACDALAAYPSGLQIGGGITTDNAELWLGRGASHVIVTSFLFDGAQLSFDRVQAMAGLVGPARLVIDLSCRKTVSGYFVATNRWQTITDAHIDARLFEALAPFCAEFLIHAADVEGLCQGIDEDSLTILARDCPLPSTYAGGARALDDLDRVAALSGGRVDLTFGSALDLFGGRLVRYQDCVQYNQRQRQA
jgi:phosphoribosylformimino-5-aminoimidazole carboxamide ribotide isomerase